jgi:hypothetical protein
MSDFLSNLLDRSLGLATPEPGSGIRRYRPSMFEPASEPLADEASVVATPTPIRLERGIASPTASPVVPIPPPAEPQGLTVPRSVTPAPEMLPQVVRETVVSQPATATPPPVVSTHTIVERETRHIETIVERSAGFPVLRNTAPQPARWPEARVATPSIVGERPVVISDHVPPPLRPAPAMPVPQAPIATIRAPGRPQAPPPGRPIFMQRQSAPPAQPATTPPPIEITIGRLEVRAAPATSTPSAGRASRGPALGLDDYLRQRNRGAA